MLQKKKKWIHNPLQYKQRNKVSARNHERLVYLLLLFKSRASIQMSLDMHALDFV